VVLIDHSLFFFVEKFEAFFSPQQKKNEKTKRRECECGERELQEARGFKSRF